MFHLEFNIPSSADKISIKDSIISMGSCFAESMGQKLIDFKFDCLSNSFGTIYNPISLSEILNDAIDEESVVEHKEVYYHWQAHGAVSALTSEDLSELIEGKRFELQSRLKTCKWLVLTLGSAFAYRLKNSGQIVANCHKVPQSEFTKELLEVNDMFHGLKGVLSEIKIHNKELKVVLTVSPVRHFRDGLVENNRSKARLIEIAQALSWEADWIKYFPSYELQMDVLRDYRFYARDLVHPSEEAVEYIWERFIETYFDKETTSFIKDWTKIRAAINHRPFHISTSDHQKFIKATIAKLSELGKIVDVSDEVSLLDKQLT